MTFQILRNAEGKLRGFAILGGRDKILTPDPEAKWRVCDVCLSHWAMVWCTRHVVYVCEECLSRHNGLGCNYLSVRAAKEQAEKNAKRQQEFKVTIARRY